MPDSGAGAGALPGSMPGSMPGGMAGDSSAGRVAGSGALTVVGAVGSAANSSLPNGSSRQFERVHGSLRGIQLSVSGSKMLTL